MGRLLPGFAARSLLRLYNSPVLSLTVLTHRKLRRAGVEAELQVFEGMSHAQYNFDPYALETKEVFGEIARFFDKHLGR